MDEIILEAGFGFPETTANRTLIVIFVGGNSALLSDGTRISRCGLDEVGITKTGRNLEEFEVSQKAKMLLHKAAITSR